MRMFGFGLVWLMVSGCQAGVASIGGDDASAKPDEDELSAIDSDRDGLADGVEDADNLSKSRIGNSFIQRNANVVRVNNS